MNFPAEINPGITASVCAHSSHAQEIDRQQTIAFFVVPLLLRRLAIVLYIRSLTGEDLWN